MKRKRIYYEDCITYQNIEYIYLKIKKSIRNKKKIEQFENHYCANIANIYNSLINKSYNVGKYNIFLIKEPKKRLIMSQELGDKIINHFVAYFYLIPILEPSLINSNVAVRKNMGTRKGIELLKKYLNSNKDKNFYILKCDIKKYFYNIDHQILKNMLQKKIRDNNILELLYKIIDSTNANYINDKIEKMGFDSYYKFEKGLPIGNMTSQIFAIYYLNGLDHHIKEKLGIKSYLRYMDDFVLIHESKEYLKWCLVEIDKYLKSINLELNSKTKIYNKSNYLNFLGYNFIVKNNRLFVLLNNKNKRKIIRKINLYNKKRLEYERIVSYKGYIKYSSNKKIAIKK